MAARLKLKGLSGGLVNWWNMWFNVIVLVQPYLLLNEPPSGVDRCCMSVVSDCREIGLVHSGKSRNSDVQFPTLYMLPEKSAKLRFGKYAKSLYPS